MMIIKTNGNDSPRRIGNITQIKIYLFNSQKDGCDLIDFPIIQKNISIRFRR